MSLQPFPVSSLLPLSGCRFHIIAPAKMHHRAGGVAVMRVLTYVPINLIRSFPGTTNPGAEGEDTSPDTSCTCHFMWEGEKCDVRDVAARLSCATLAAGHRDASSAVMAEGDYVLLIPLSDGKAAIPWVAWCSQTESSSGALDWVTYLTLRAAPGRNVAERYAYVVGYARHSFVRSPPVALLRSTVSTVDHGRTAAVLSSCSLALLRSTVSADHATMAERQQIHSTCTHVGSGCISGCYYPTL